MHGFHFLTSCCNIYTLVSRSRGERAKIRFVNLTPSTYEAAAPRTSQPYTHDLSTTRKLETERRVVTELREKCIQELVEMEVEMNIVKRWDPTTPEYQETLGYLSTRRYQRALEELQRLVVQRLFELHKMNLSATGEFHLEYLGPSS